MNVRVISGLALLCVALVTTPAMAKDTERVDRTARIPANGQLRLKNFSGKVTITGTNRGDVAIHAIRRADRDRLNHIHLEVVETGSGVTIEANKKDAEWTDRNNNVVETDFDIEVPADVSLDLNVFSSDVQVTDVRGSQRIKTFSGEVNVTGAWASIDAETFSGDITVGLANSAGGHVDFDSFSGSLHSDQPMQMHSTSRRHFTANLGSGNNDYHFKTFSGDVRIK
jgi:Putative adhesin